jgi:hypothetical protein
MRNHHNAQTHSLFPDRMNKYHLLSLERPAGLIGEPIRGEDLTFMLPTRAKEAGMVLLDVTYRQPEKQVDPYIIYSQDGRLLHAWPENYTPGPVEIWKVAEVLIGK